MRAILLVTIKELWSIMREHLDLTKKLGTNKGKLQLMETEDLRTMLLVTIKGLWSIMREHLNLEKNETGNKRVKALAYENLRTSYIKLGDYQRTEDYLERARKIQKETLT